MCDMAYWPIYMCDMTHLYVWYDLFMCVKWLIYKCDTTHVYTLKVGPSLSATTMIFLTIVWVTWLICIFDMTLLYVWRDSLICSYNGLLAANTITFLMIGWVKQLLYFIYILRDSFICVTWLIHMCDVTYSYAIKEGLDFVWTNVRIHWNPVYTAFHRIRSCGNEPIVR